MSRKKENNEEAITQQLINQNQKTSQILSATDVINMVIISLNFKLIWIDKIEK